METTFPRLLMQHAAQRPQAPAMREKEYGIWQTWSWARAAEDVRLMSCGLAALGFQPGQNLAIVGDNRPHLYQAFSAAHSLRGVPVPMYQDAIASEMAFVLEDAEIHFAFAENQEQVHKLLELRESVPGLLQHIVFDDPPGLRNYQHEGLISIRASPDQVAQAWEALSRRVGGSPVLDEWLTRSGIEPSWARAMVAADVERQGFIEARFQAFAFVSEDDVLAALGPGPHDATRRASVRADLEREAAERGLARWIEEARREATTRHVLAEGATVPCPLPMPPCPPPRRPLGDRHGHRG